MDCRYFVFTSFWAYKIYYVYGFMWLVTGILSVVTVCVTIVCCYFLLNAEDYRWRWTSFLAGASTAAYVYLYSVYYFLFKTKSDSHPAFHLSLSHLSLLPGCTASSKPLSTSATWHSSAADLASCVVRALFSTRKT